jgi:hypothetical protein
VIEYATDNPWLISATSLTGQCRRHRVSANSAWRHLVRDNPTREAAADAIGVAAAEANTRLVRDARGEELKRDLAQSHDDLLKFRSICLHEREAAGREILASYLPKLRLAGKANPVEWGEKLLAIEWPAIGGTLLGGRVMFSGKAFFGFDQFVNERVEAGVGGDFHEMLRHISWIRRRMPASNRRVGTLPNVTVLVSLLINECHDWFSELKAALS